MAAGDGSADREPLVEGYDELVPLGRGGFATVYRARQHRFDRTVALKVLDLERPDEEDRRRFDRECRAVGALSWHPNIVVVHDSGLTSDGRLYLAMEYLAEGSFAHRVRAEGPLPWAEALPVGVELAGALEVAHRTGTLHRDLKPDNVLIGPFGEAKLADFGIAAVDGGTVTATGHGALTVLYAAPEILQGGRASVRTEVYGLASTLYALLAGRAAYARDHDESIAAVVLRACSQPAPDLAERGVPGDLAAVVAAGMAIDPDDRPETAAELGRALQEVEAAHGLTVTALRTEPGGRRAAPRRAPGDAASAEARGDGAPTVAAPSAEARGDDAPTVAAPTARPPEKPPPPPAPRRRRVLVVLAAIAAVVAVGVFLAVRRDGSGDAGGAEVVLEDAFSTSTSSSTTTSTSTTTTTILVGASSADAAARLLVEAWLAGDADAAAAVAEAGVVDELFASSTAGVTADSTDCVPFRFDIGGGSCTFASASGPGTLTVSDRDGRFVVIGVDRG